MSPRYAIYYVPAPDDALYQKASAWLGWDSHLGKEVDHPKLGTLQDSEHRKITQKPATYGFHATLKPPFHLGNGYGEGELIATADSFAQSHGPVSLGVLSVSKISNFIALTPSVEEKCLQDFAASCVRDFDRFRRAMAEDERLRRMKGGISGQQMKLLETWGYPYVMEEFRFHMTLTATVDDGLATRLAVPLKDYLAGVLEAPLQLDRLAVLRQESEGSPFRVIYSALLNSDLGST